MRFLSSDPNEGWKAKENSSTERSGSELVLATVFIKIIKGTAVKEQTHQLFTYEPSAFGAFQVGESPGYLALLILPWGESFVRNDDGVDWIVNADTENIY